MSKRKREPDEALGPQVNGLETINFSTQPPVVAPEPEPEPEPVEEIVENPVVLICGAGEKARIFAELAGSCGFTVELAEKADIGEAAGEFPGASQIHIVPDYDDFVASCGVDRNCFICVFVEDARDRTHIIGQCLESEAGYLGLLADENERAAIFAELKAAGAPDAELAAVCCPMGLNVGASTPWQLAAGIVAELLAARAGTLTRLRYEP